MAEHVEEQWAVDLGFAVTRVPDEAHARRWVQSYRDHPEALSDGDPMPVAIRRTVTTTAWEPVAPADAPPNDAPGEPSTAAMADQAGTASTP